MNVQICFRKCKTLKLRELRIGSSPMCMRQSQEAIPVPFGKPVRLRMTMLSTQLNAKTIRNGDCCCCKHSEMVSPRLLLRFAMLGQDFTCQDTRSQCDPSNCSLRVLVSKRRTVTHCLLQHPGMRLLIRHACQVLYPMLGHVICQL